MIEAPVPDNDAERLEAMDAAMCAFVPREERFDRITRTVRRLLGVPMALISIVEIDKQWFRSAQGLQDLETPRNISFCGHAVASGKMLIVHDATSDPRFWDNPLVTDAPYIRSYLGIPLTLSPGIRVGTLCALDTRVREFNQQDILGMQDLAAMAEAELRIDSLGATQKQLLGELGKAERRNSMDTATGCWNARAFRELVSLTAADCLMRGSTMALCYVRVRNFDELASRGDKVQANLMRQLLAQVLRRRLPQDGALGSLGERDFCALIPGATPLDIEASLAQFTFPQVTLDMPGFHLDMTLDLAYSLAFLSDMKSGSPSTELWATTLSGLKD